MPQFVKNTLPNPPYKISRRAFLKGIGIAALGTSMLVLGGTTIASMVDDPDYVEVVRMEIELPSLDAEFNGFKLLQIADIHMDEWMDQTRLESILQTCRGLSPELIVITGDFLTRDVKAVVPPMIGALKPLGESLPVLAVLGNNDYRYDNKIMHDVLKECNIMELNNKVHTITRSDAQLHIAGLDDLWYGEPDIAKVLRETPPAGAAILLIHEPDYADISAKSGRFGLQLSGHTHGGQVNLPGIGTPITPPYGHKYVAGLYQVGNMLQYTNRGLGYSQMEPRIRINCPPEITLFTLQS